MDWLERYSASIGLRLNEAMTQASRMEVRAHDLEVELARANNEHNVQRAVAEQRAKEAELQVAALHENVEALMARRRPSPSRKRRLSLRGRGSPSQCGGCPQSCVGGDRRGEEAHRG